MEMPMGWECTRFPRFPRLCGLFASKRGPRCYLYYCTPLYKIEEIEETAYIAVGWAVLVRGFLGKPRRNRGTASRADLVGLKL